MMTIRSILVAAMLASAGLAPLHAAPPTETVAVTHVIGDPEAGTRLTEYVSYTCSHCADFEMEAGEVLKLAYVPTGDLAVEVRHLVRDPVDMTVALIAHCGDADRFAANHTYLLREQAKWLGAIMETTPAQRARYQAGTFGARHRAIARDAGLYDLMKKRGYQPSQLDHCLDNEALGRALAEASQEYREAGVRGTPSFAVNGTLLDGVHDWKSLEPVLQGRDRP